MSNLAKSDNSGQIAPVQDFGAGLLAVIERAARDPNTDVDKMERLFALQERVIERQSKAAFTEAKISMRPHLPAIDQRGRIIIRDKNNPDKIIQETAFSRFEDIHAAVEPVLIEHGFDLKFKNGTAPDGKVRVTTVLAHVGGHEEDTYFDLPHDSSGSKNAVQAIGSSTSYAKRYGTIAILNLRVAGEDDDGKKGGANTVTDDQEANLIALIEDVKADKAKFLKFLGVSRIEDIPSADYSKAIALLEKKRGQ